MTHAISRTMSAGRDEMSHLRDPIAKTSSLVITGSAVGGVLSIGLFMLVWEPLQEVRLFLIAALAVGGVFGFILWLRRRQSMSTMTHGTPMGTEPLIRTRRRFSPSLRYRRGE